MIVRMLLYPIMYYLAEDVPLLLRPSHKSKFEGGHSLFLYKIRNLLRLEYNVRSQVHVYQ